MGVPRVIVSLARGGGQGRWVLPMIFVIAVAIRLVALVAIPHRGELPDSQDYDRQARQLLAGQGYLTYGGIPTSWRPPGYAGFLAGVYALAGPRPDAVRVVQILLDGATCVLVFVLARRLFGFPAAAVSAALVVVSLTQISASRFILAESLATFLIVLIGLLLHEGLTRPSRIALAAVGLLFGASVLVKGTLLVCLALTPIFIGWALAWRWRQAVIASLLVVGMAALVLAPWTIRNYRVHGRFIPVSTQIGFLVYCGVNPRHGYAFGYCYGPEVKAVKNALPEAEASAEFLRQALQRVGDHPSMLPGNIALKLAYFFSPIDWEFLPRAPGGGVVDATYVFTLPFAVGGAVLARRRGWAAALPGLFVAGVLVTVVLTESSPRYRLPVEPFVAIYAGLGLSSLQGLAPSARRVALTGVLTHIGLSAMAFIYSDAVRLLARAALGLGSRQ